MQKNLSGITYTYLWASLYFTFKNIWLQVSPQNTFAVNPCRRLSLALLGIFNQPVNLFHIIAVFLIIGFGLDYSVFRFGGAKKSADAVLISCLTSVFSFTLLALTGFKLISSLGYILAAGLIFSYIFSLVCIKDRWYNFLYEV